MDREYSFVFDQLSDNLLDKPYNYASTTATDATSPSSGSTISGVSELSEDDKATSEFLEAIYTQMESWLATITSYATSSKMGSSASTNPSIASRSMKILHDFQKNIRFLTRLLRNNRYPRLALIGRRGAGKSSLINALLGEQVAAPGHVRAQTGRSKLLLYRTKDGHGIDVLDTRGLNEGGLPLEEDDHETAVDSVVDALRTVPVDAILFVHKIKEVDAGIESDLKALVEILEKSKLLSTYTGSVKEEKDGIPIIFVLTHTDELDPSDLKRPADYDDEKLKAIHDAEQQFLLNVNQHAPKIVSNCHYNIVSASGAVIWMPPDENGRVFPHPKRDYRYNIDKLLDLLLRNMELQAVFRTVQATRSKKVKIDFALFLSRIFASIAAIFALTPFPTTDVVPLTALISYQVYTIARLGTPTRRKEGQDSTAATTPTSPTSISGISKFLGIIGLTSVLGLGARYLLTTALKIMMVPGSSAGSAVVSYSMVMAIGKAAVSYFLEEKGDDEVRSVFRSESENPDNKKRGQQAVQRLFDADDDEGETSEPKKDK